MPSETVNISLAFRTIARILSMQTGLEVSVEVTKKPPHDATEKGEKHEFED